MRRFPALALLLLLLPPRLPGQQAMPGGATLPGGSASYGSGSGEWPRLGLSVGQALDVLERIPLPPSLLLLRLLLRLSRPRLLAPAPAPCT